MRLKEVAGRSGVAHLATDAPIPEWSDRPRFCSIVRADDELTLISREDRISDTVPSQLGWSCFRSIGPGPFDAAGILAALISPISSAGLDAFVLCTFEGEHIMCPDVSCRDIPKRKSNLGKRRA